MAFILDIYWTVSSFLGASKMHHTVRRIWYAFLTQVILKIFKRSYLLIQTPDFTSQGDFWKQQANGLHPRHILNSFKNSRGFKNSPYGTADLICVFTHVILKIFKWTYLLIQTSDFTSQGDFWNQQANGFHPRHILNSFKNSSWQALWLEKLHFKITFTFCMFLLTLLKKVVFAQLLFPVPLCVCRSCP